MLLIFCRQLGTLENGKRAHLKQYSFPPSWWLESPEDVIHEVQQTGIMIIIIGIGRRWMKEKQIIIIASTTSFIFWFPLLDPFISSSFAMMIVPFPKSKDGKERRLRWWWSALCHPSSGSSSSPCHYDCRSIRRWVMQGSWDTLPEWRSWWHEQEPDSL